jgi:hypothetical protein
LDRREFRYSRTVPKVKLGADKQSEAVSQHLSKIRGQKILIGNIVRTILSGDYSKRKSATAKDVIDLELGSIQENALVEFIQKKRE